MWLSSATTLSIHPLDNHHFIKFPLSYSLPILFSSNWPRFSTLSSSTHFPFDRIQPSPVQTRLDKKRSGIGRNYVHYNVIWISETNNFLVGEMNKTHKFSSSFFHPSDSDTSRTIHEAIFSYFLFSLFFQWESRFCWWLFRPPFNINFFFKIFCETL